MRQIDSDKNIYLTRGDWLPLRLSLKNKYDGSDYITQENDIVRFTLYKDNVSNIILQKDFNPIVGKTYVDIDLLSEETKIGQLIEDSETYCYQVELNPDTSYAITLIGVERINNKDIPKYFYLIPEAGDK